MAAGFRAIGVGDGDELARFVDRLEFRAEPMAFPSGPSAQ